MSLNVRRYGFSNNNSRVDSSNPCWSNHFMAVLICSKFRQENSGLLDAAGSPDNMSLMIYLRSLTALGSLNPASPISFSVISEDC